MQCLDVLVQAVKRNKSTLDSTQLIIITQMLAFGGVIYKRSWCSTPGHQCNQRHRWDQEHDTNQVESIDTHIQTKELEGVIQIVWYMCLQPQSKNCCEGFRIHCCENETDSPH